VILQCLEKDAADRFPSGEALCEELVRVLQERGETATIRTSGMSTTDTLSGSVSLGRMRRRAKRTRTMWVAGGVALAALVGFAALRFRDASAASGNPQKPGVVRPGIGVPTTRRPTKPTLVVNVPEGANLAVNGAPVTPNQGNWSADTLPPGDYTVAATVNGVRGCPTLRAEETVTLAASQLDTVTLNPRNCGLLELAIVQDGATYTLSSFAGDRPRKGTTPVTGPLLLPAGTYRLLVEKKYCAQYTNTSVQVRSERPTRLYAKLYCDKG